MPAVWVYGVFHEGYYIKISVDNWYECTYYQKFFKAVQKTGCQFMIIKKTMPYTCIFERKLTEFNDYLPIKVNIGAKGFFW